MRIFPHMSLEEAAKQISQILMSKIETQFSSIEDTLERSGQIEKVANEISGHISSHEFEAFISLVSPYLQTLGDDECDFISQCQLYFPVHLPDPGNQN